jgi:hypothetical protein
MKTLRIIAMVLALAAGLSMVIVSIGFSSSLVKKTPQRMILELELKQSPKEIVDSK